MNNINLKTSFNEEPFAYQELYDLFDMYDEELLDPIEDIISYEGTDVAYHNFLIKGSPIGFSLLKKDLLPYTDSFLLIDFYERKNYNSNVYTEDSIDFIDALSLMSESAAELFVLNLGRLLDAKSIP